MTTLIAIIVCTCLEPVNSEIECHYDREQPFVFAMQS